MKPVIKYGCGGILVVGVLGACVLLLLALLSKPLPTTQEALASLSEAERGALAKVCESAGVEVGSLRHIANHERGLFAHASNAKALVVREGRLVGLCLRGAQWKSAPDVSALASLEALDLSEGSLATWPDCSRLMRLERLNLSRSPINHVDASLLPPNVRVLLLAETRIADTRVFAGVKSLAELDLAQTPVSDFSPLLPLRLEKLNLARSAVAAMPAQLPAAGEWEVNLDGTPVLNPPGYAAKWPFGGWIKNQHNNADAIQGTVSNSTVDAKGTVPEITEPRGVRLPRTDEPNAPPVEMEVTLASGRAKVWLIEPPGFFPSPWMREGKVAGFGMLRRKGFVWAEVAPGAPAKLRGSLSLTTQSRRYEAQPQHRNESLRLPDWCYYSFYIEPLDGQPAKGLSFQARAAR